MALRVAVLATVSTGLLALPAAPASAQTGPDGATLVKQRCGACHTPGKSGMGPDLTGLMTRTARPKFAYSPAMQKQPVRWDAKRLDAFLAGPAKAVPGTKMMISVPNAGDRGKIVAYLAALK